MQLVLSKRLQSLLKGELLEQPESWNSLIKRLRTKFQLDDSSEVLCEQSFSSESVAVEDPNIADVTHVTESQIDSLKRKRPDDDYPASQFSDQFQSQRYEVSQLPKRRNVFSTQEPRQESLSSHSKESPSIISKTTHVTFNVYPPSFDKDSFIMTSTPNNVNLQPLLESDSPKGTPKEGTQGSSTTLNSSRKSDGSLAIDNEVEGGGNEGFTPLPAEEQSAGVVDEEHDHEEADRQEEWIEEEGDDGMLLLGQRSDEEGSSFSQEADMQDPFSFELDEEWESLSQEEPLALQENSVSGVEQSHTMMLPRIQALRMARAVNMQIQLEHATQHESANSTQDLEPDKENMQVKNSNSQKSGNESRSSEENGSASVNGGYSAGEQSQMSGSPGKDFGKVEKSQSQSKSSSPLRSSVLKEYSQNSMNDDAENDVALQSSKESGGTPNESSPSMERFYTCVEADASP